MATKSFVRSDDLSRRVECKDEKGERAKETKRERKRESENKKVDTIELAHLISSALQTSKHRSSFPLFRVYRVGCLNENVAAKGA